MTDVPTNDEDNARNQINDWLNKPMRVSIVDGRVLVGVLLCTDRDRNIILGSCNEYIGSPSEQEEFRVLGLALVPGQHIQSIHIDENLPPMIRHFNQSQISTMKTNDSTSNTDDHLLDDDRSDG